VKCSAASVCKLGHDRLDIFYRIPDPVYGGIFAEFSSGSGYNHLTAF